MAAFAGVVALGVFAFGGSMAGATDVHPSDETLHRACTWTVDKATHHTTVTLSIDQQVAIGYTITVRATCTDSHHDPGSDGTDHHGGTHHAIDGVIEGHNGIPDHIVNECVVLDDTFAGGPQDLEICLDDLVNGQTVINYQRTLGPYSTCGDRTVSNTATLYDHHGVALVWDTVNVHVRVPCATGCTLTQGYWKTHSEQGPAAKPDDAWNLVPLVYPGAPSGLAEDTPFYYSGQTWLEVFWTPPSGGNVYYQLAHQYMAAVLNRLNGASSTTAVNTALTNATTYFNNPANTPASALLLSKSQRNTLQGYASTLGAYNEGTIRGGPPHCDEEHTH
jgi:hypothetical protein